MNTPDQAPPFGRLELQAPIGIGPMSSRYSAREPGGAGEHGVIELRALHELSPGQRARLIQLAALRHDGLLPVRSLQLDGPRPHYITVHGPNAGWAESAPRSIAGLRAALTELSDALAAAHREGLVHGTLEAAHILRAPRGWWLDLTGTDPSPRPRRAPELANGQAATSAADVWALGTIVIAALPSRDDADLEALLAEMTATDPETRPTADRVAGRLDRTMAAQVASPTAPKTIPNELGPYALLEKLGEGGMGAVYRARGRGEDHDVALKVLLPEWSRDALVLARFRREARVLSQLSTPHIARFIAARRDAEWEYLVMEFVEGRSAHWLLQKRGPFSVRATLAIGCDIGRALAEVHALDLVHRDVKPSNILIAADSDVAIEPRSKLCDFGIVRPKVDDDAGALTRTGTPGTPSYMAPEQVLGNEVSAATDTYALGATLFALLTGKPPFVGDSNAVMLAHLSEPPPSLLDALPGIDPGVADLIARALSKDPTDRPRDARAMLEELEVLRRGAAIAVEALPQASALEGEPSRYAYAWDLKSTPEELWPHVSNTERLNRAIGLEDVVWAREGVGEASKMTGSFRAAGMTLKWKENPFEWVAPHRLGVVREYESGPFDWMRSTVELTPTDGGTRLSHTIEMKPRGFLGRAAAGIEVGMRMRRALERTYKRIDDACVRARATEARPEDPFEQPAALSMGQRDLLHARLDRARAQGGDDHVLDALGDWVLTAPPQSIARVRPHAFADQYKLSREATLSAFLLAANEGVLAMLWDILCPTCRIPSQLHETLKALEDHGRCDACDVDFELDLARSVELVFRVESSVRSADLGMYCIGGPAHSPHVVAQVRLPKGQRFSLPVTLSEGAYQIRGRGLPKSHPFRAIRGAPLRAWSVSLRDGLDPEALRIVGEGAMHIELSNDLERDVVVRLERSTERRDLVTAADATSNPLFRRLFPQQILSPEELIGISQVALLCAEVPDAGGRYQTHDDRLVHADLIELQRQVTEAAEAEGGALVKLQLEGVLAVFADPAAATRASIRLLTAMKGEVRASVHAGTAMLTTINQRLDYFGRTVFTAAELLREARAGEVVVSEETQRADPEAGRTLEAVELVGVVQRHAIGMRYRLRTA